MSYLLEFDPGDTARSMKTYTFFLGVVSAVSLCVLGCGDNADEEVGTTSNDGGAGGESASDGGVGGESANGDELSCSERSASACSSEDERCYLVKARQVVESDDGYCRSDVVHTECRELGDDCSDNDAESHWCDDDGGLWWTPQTCGPERFETCAAPSGEAMTSCP